MPSAMKQRKAAWVVAWAVLSAGLWGCEPPTSFQGEAKFPGGVQGCQQQCAARGLEMGSFIYIGAYSTACACRAKNYKASIAQPSDEDDAAAVAAAAAGVELQRRSIEAARTQNGVIGASVAR
jgi:hypothetical protein